MRKHRSFTMWLIAQMLPKLQFPGMRDAEDAEAYMQRAMTEGEKPADAQIAAKCKGPVSLNDYDGMPVFCFGDADSKGPVVLYLHGGAYVYQLDPSQAAFCDKLSRSRGALVIAPCYPLAPHHTFTTAYDMLTRLYESLCGRYQQGITLLGDSAGAGLAAGLTAVWIAKGMPTPKRLILCSPWVDLEMKSTDYSLRQSEDPMLNEGALRVMAHYWAGDTPLSDIRLSPTNADCSAFPPVDIHSGTREILYDDAYRYYRHLMTAGVETTFTTGKKLTHDYLMIPAPEQAELIATFTL